SLHTYTHLYLHTHTSTPVFTNTIPSLSNTFTHTLRPTTFCSHTHSSFPPHTIPSMHTHTQHTSLTLSMHISFSQHTHTHTHTPVSPSIHAQRNVSPSTHLPSLHRHVQPSLSIHTHIP
ncbi:hypothetical protein DBR06_SOUSAS11210010, partial [Sousa chinensis]